MKKTAVIGASPNPSRYSSLAIEMLKEYAHDVVPLGFRKGDVAGESIITDWPEMINDLDTITLYLNPSRQVEHYEYLLGLNPRRIVFNPGTENAELAVKAKEKGIETEEACTLVLLRTGQY